MSVSGINNFKNYYKSSDGQIVERLIKEEIQNYWNHFENENILSFGYHFMHDEYDIARFGYENNYSKISINQVALPFKDESIDRVLIYNYFEFSLKKKLLFKEFWRILSPGGLILIVVPNRTNMIKLNKSETYENKNFFSLYQMLELMSKNNFVTTKSSSRIFFSPRLYKFCPKIYNFIDNLFGKWLIPFGGFIFIEAKKDLAHPISNINEKVFAYRHF